MFDGYVLTGGKSRRMGTDKFALRFGDATFSMCAAAAMRKAVRVCFVVGADQKSEPLPLDVPRVTDIFPDKAALGGIYTALADAKSEWAAILACDFPFVTEDLIARLAKIAHSVSEDIAAVAPVQPDGRIQPLCAFYRVAECRAAAQKLLSGDSVRPARRIIETVAARLVSYDEYADLSGAEDFFMNINTPGEFLNMSEAARKRKKF